MQTIIQSSVFKMPLPLIPVTFIPLKKSLRISTGMVNRLDELDYIFVKDREIVDCVLRPNYIITACWQSGESYEVSAMNLVTRELIKIKIP